MIPTAAACSATRSIEQRPTATAIQIHMSDSTNARKLFQSGGSTVVSFPSDFLAEHGLEQGDRVRFREEDGQIIMEEVEFTVTN